MNLFTDYGQITVITIKHCKIRPEYGRYAPLKPPKGVREITDKNTVGRPNAVKAATAGKTCDFQIR